MMASNKGIGGNVTHKKKVQGFLAPDLNSISYSACFHDYYFKFSKNTTDKEVDTLVTCARSKNPLTSEIEDYIGMGLLSSHDGKNHREDLTF